MAREEIIKVNVPRANPEVVQYLLDLGIIYVGEDNQLHVIEL